MKNSIKERAKKVPKRIKIRVAIQFKLRQYYVSFSVLMAKLTCKLIGHKWYQSTIPYMGSARYERQSCKRCWKTVDTITPLKH